VALIRLTEPADGLSAVTLGDSDALAVGDWVVAIGNPFGLASSVSAGIISARARNIEQGPYDDFLQTDAAINPGNSGGPLFNLQGQVVGINTAIVGRGSGIGFAVPSNLVQHLLPYLKKGERVARGFLGVAIDDLTPELAQRLNVRAEAGAVVLEVTPGAPAEAAGLHERDVIVAVDGERIDSRRSLMRLVGFRAPGSQVKLSVLRGGERRELSVTLTARPPAPGEQEGSAEEEEHARSLLAALGMSLRGTRVVEVEPGSPADDAGLLPGMVIVDVSGVRVQSERELVRVLSGAPPGATLLLRARAGSRTVMLALTLP
jgi:serine protease Do